jgi:hypothetical protein
VSRSPKAVAGCVQHKKRTLWRAQRPRSRFPKSPQTCARKRAGSKGVTTYMHVVTFFPPKKTFAHSPEKKFQKKKIEPFRFCSTKPPPLLNIFLPLLHLLFFWASIFFHQKKKADAMETCHFHLSRSSVECTLLAMLIQTHPFKSIHGNGQGVIRSKKVSVFFLLGQTPHVHHQTSFILLKIVTFSKQNEKVSAVTLTKKKDFFFLFFELFFWKDPPCIQTPPMSQTRCACSRA